MSLKSKIESVLFVSTKPLSIKQFENILGHDKKEIENALEELSSDLNQEGRGVNLVSNNKKYQLTTSAENSELIKEMIKSELTGELTKPSLETLTVIAYRGPITKAELEQIRGVNCSLILRNLMMRGLVEAEYDKSRAITLYGVTLEFMKFLGITDIKELPEYENLNSDEKLHKLLDEKAMEGVEVKGEQ